MKSDPFSFSIGAAANRLFREKILAGTKPAAPGKGKNYSAPLGLFFSQLYHKIGEFISVNVAVDEV